VTAPTALYRRYRPDSFADVIGQEHVTAPLMAALDKNRVNHAYLFSGPRGCGKTTSARILARCLNCAKGPTSHPCGECDSCIELARGGAGSLDVIEIDAASHGGVDDARDLRERATFAPIRDRYKIFIIDEAHMVTSAGFNALLKIVEEPPEHIKFIFATTEPDKVIGTIRSRTHHYPFRLVPPEPLMAYLAQLCEQENVPVAPGVLSLVIRAGGGSVRDSLSVLDQLMAGAGPAGLDYELAVSLLGYTHASLLDDVVEAVAAADAATVFKSVDRVIQTGHDPRRFVEDLLERFRDLIIVQAMPESAHAILRGMPDDQISRMQTQAAQLGASELSRAADITNAALNEMSGATSPRLHLELLSARLLLPGADTTARGMAARLDQMERRLNYGGAPAAGSDAPAFAGTTAPQQDIDSASSGGGLAAVRAQLAKAKEAAEADNGRRAQAAQAAQAAQDDSARTSAPATVPVQNSAPAHNVPEPAPVPQGAPVQGTPSPAAQNAPVQNLPAGGDWPEVAEPGRAPEEPTVQQRRPEAAPAAQTRPEAAPAAAPQPQAAQAQAAQSQPAQAAPVAQPSGQAPSQSPAPPAAGGGNVEVIRRAWPEILDNLTKIKRSSWALIGPNATPQAFDGKTLLLGFNTAGLAGAFSRGEHSDNLRQAIHVTLGITCTITPVAGDAPVASSEPNPKAPTEPAPRSGGAPSSVAPAAIKTAPPAPTPVAAPLAQAPSAPSPTATPATPPGGPRVDAIQRPVDPWQPRQETQQAQAPASDDDWHTREAPESEDPWAPSDWAPANTAPTNTAPASPVAAAPATTTPPAQATATTAPAATTPATTTPAATTPATTTPATTTPAATAPVPTAPADPANEWATTWAAPDAVAADSAPVTPMPLESVQELNARLTASWKTAPSADVAEAADDAAAPVADPEPTIEAAPEQAPAAPVPQPTSSIAAWTSGWDTEPASEEPTGDEAPEAEAPGTTGRPGSRFEMLQAQARQQNETAANPDMPQDFTPRVTDPGWGAPASAPDWAQPSTAPEAPASGGAPDSSSPAPAAPESPAPATAEEPEPRRGEGKMSMYQRLSNSPEAQAARAQAPSAPAAAYVEDIPSADDVTIEESGLVGRAAVERILGGRFVEERPLNGRQ
jgi:DNA polymerase III subunit gamma/tau